MHGPYCVFVYLASCLLASAYFRPIVYIYFSVCIKPVGVVPMYPAFISLPLLLIGMWLDQRVAVPFAAASKS